MGIDSNDFYGFRQSVLEENDSDVVSAMIGGWSLLNPVPACFSGKVCFIGYFIYHPCGKYNSISRGDLNFRSGNHISSYVVPPIWTAKIPAAAVTRYLPRQQCSYILKWVA